LERLFLCNVHSFIALTKHVWQYLLFEMYQLHKKLLKTFIEKSLCKQDHLLNTLGNWVVFVVSASLWGENLCGITVSALLGVPFVTSLISMWFSHEENPAESTTNTQNVNNFILYFFMK
jgi:integral membrane sensor domain MASE1